MNFDFDGDMAKVSAAALALTTTVLYPLVQLRRRVDVGGGKLVEKGSSYLHPGLQGPLVCVLLGITATAFCALSGEPLFPVLAATATGYAGARVAHEARKAASTRK